MCQAGGRASAQGWVGNTGNRSHKAPDSCKVLTGYRSALLWVSVFSSGIPTMFILTCLCLHKDVREEESKKDTT